MHRFVRGLLFASAAPFLIVPPAILNSVPAQAQPADISFDSFHDQLNNYGDWLYSDRWGEVWRPWQQDQNPDWRPYSVGHWVYTSEYGWTWISEEGPWGDIAYHYGRWVYDPDDGWLWLTGYVWSPAWVVWRSAGPNVGWMPMPPDDTFLGFSSPGLSVNVNFGDWEDTGGFYGYARWYGPRFDENRFGAMWTFVPSAHVADPVYRNYVVPRPQVVNIVRVSHNVTNYTVVNNVIINKSVNITMVQGAGGRPVVPVHAAAVLPTTRWVAPVTRGQQVQAQMRQVHPRGNGLINSAPQPTPQQVRALSPQPRAPVAAAGGGGHHVFSQANVAQIQVRPPAGPGNAPANRLPNATAPANNFAPRDNGMQRDNAMQRQDFARPPRPNDAASGPARDFQQRPDHMTPPPSPAPNAPPPANNFAPRDNAMPRQDFARPPRPNDAASGPTRDLQQRPDHMAPSPSPAPNAPPPANNFAPRDNAMPRQDFTRPATPPPPRPAPVEARPQRPPEPQGQVPQRQMPPREAPPRQAPPRPVSQPHPGATRDEGGSGPEHHGDDHKQEH